MITLARRLFAMLFPVTVAIGVKTSDGRIVRLYRSLRVRPVWNPVGQACAFYHGPYQFSLFELGDPIPKTSMAAVIYWVPMWRFGLWSGQEKIVVCDIDPPVEIDLDRKSPIGNIEYGGRPAFII